jgi:hypothetical protein
MADWGVERLLSSRAGLVQCRCTNVSSSLSLQRQLIKLLVLLLALLLLLLVLGR